MGKLSTSWKQFSYLPRSLTSTAASENGAWQCAMDYWECTHFREATQSQIPMDEERCPPCKYSLKRTSTNLIQFCGRTVLLAETCSQLALLLSVPQLSERKHLVECYHDIYRNRINPPQTKSLPQPTRTWNCTCREPICKCCHGRWRTSLTLQMYN